MSFPVSKKPPANKFLWLICAVALVPLLLPAPAHAYLDPGTGSYLFQIIVGVLAGALLTVKLFFARIRAFFSGGRRATRKSGEKED